MAALRTLILFAICFAAAGDRPRPAWDQLYTRLLTQLDLAKFDAARTEADAGYRFWQGSPNSLWHWRFRLALSDSLIGLDRVGEVQKLLDEAAPCEELEAHRQVNLAYVSYRAHDFEAVRRRLDTAESLAPGGPAELLGRMDLIRGMISLNQEHLPEAEASFRRALDAVAGTHSLVESYTLTDLGFLDLRQFRYDEAVFWFERARKLAERTGSTRALALAAGNLGEAYLRLGDFERALTFLDQAVAVAERTGDRVYQVGWLQVMGELWHYLNDDSKAAHYFEKARALANTSRDEEWLVRILDNLGELALARGDLGEAERLNAQTDEIAKRIGNPRARIIPTVRAAEILRAQKQEPAAAMRYREAIQLSRRVEDPYSLWYSYAGLASLDSSAGRIREAGHNYRLAIATIDAQRSRLQHEESKFTFLSHLIRFYREYVDFLVERGNTAAAFGVVESCRARVLAEKLHGAGAAKAANLRDLQTEARRSQTVFLSYWLAPRRSFLWVVDGAGLHQFTLPAEQEITENVRRYTGALLRAKDPLATENAAGRWLFTNLIDSVYPVRRGSKVVIVPDGSLHQLNFESLPAGEGTHYWIADVTVSVAPALAVLGRLQTPGPERLLLIGAPKLEGSDYAPLPNLPAEVEAVSRRFASREVYTGAAATPAAYRKEDLKSYSTLHFATHAVANRENPLDSAIILSGNAGNRKLYARDVLAHPLRADLVTLSACQTAGNRTYHGEGLTGLAWAFLSAGARNVVAGLWEVDDRATAELMDHFYEARAKGRSPASALREAKLRLIASQGAHHKPLYWAAFETFSRTLDEM